MFGLRVINALTVVPYLEATAPSVSPFWMT